MMSPSSLRVNPDVLRWAREESGYEVDDIPNTLGVDVEQYREWEEVGTDIPFSVLQRISKTFKRQIAVFFLRDVPRKTPRPTDYRNLSASEARLSPDTMLALRQANTFAEVLREVNGEEYYREKNRWLAMFPPGVANAIEADSTAFAVRGMLQYSVADQMNDKYPGDAFRNMRNSIENELGIHTFQLSMPTEEVQGFCNSESFPYWIVVNSKYSVSSKIFTLFHELGHILGRQSALCLPDIAAEDQETELACNEFAGRILLPAHLVVRSLNRDAIYRRARKLKVSSEVYLRRSKSLGQLADHEFFTLLEEIRSAVRPTSSFGISNPVQRSINSRGRMLFDSVVSAVQRNDLSYGRASSVLGLKANYFLSV